MDIQYVCDSRFVVTNALMNPVKVVYRVVGSGEDHPLTLRPTPAMHIAFSDAPIDGQGHRRRRGAARRQADRLPRERPGALPAGGAQAPGLAALAAPTSAEAGEWSAPFDWPIVAVHLHLLPNGQVLSWGHDGTPQTLGPGQRPLHARSRRRTCCSALGMRSCPTGGSSSPAATSPRTTACRSPTSTAPAPAGRPRRRCSKGRWYPSVTVMPNGEAVILSGTDQRGAKVVVPEVWNAGSIRALTGANRKIPYYPRAFVAPNGLLFNAGKAQPSAYLRSEGQRANGWTWRPGCSPTATTPAPSMYSPGKILFAGGGLTTNTAEIIDLNQPTPAWSYTGSMAFARRHHNLTMLPTGEVLATDGVNGTAFNDLTKPVLRRRDLEPRHRDLAHGREQQHPARLPRHRDPAAGRAGAAGRRRRRRQGGGPVERGDLFAALPLRRPAPDHHQRPGQAAGGQHLPGR